MKHLLLSFLLLFNSISAGQASLFFDEIDDKVIITDNADWTLPDSDWIIAYWLKLRVVSVSFSPH